MMSNAARPRRSAMVRMVTPPGVVDRDVAGHLRPHHQLAQVGVGGVHQAARLGGGQHHGGVRGAGRDQVGPLQRVHRDVHRGRRVRVADLLTDVEHRRLVALALADDDGAADLRLFHGVAHRLDGGAVGAHPVATSHEPRRGDGPGLGGRDRLDGDQLVHWGGLSGAGRRKASAPARAEFGSNPTIRGDAFPTFWA